MSPTTMPFAVITIAAAGISLIASLVTWGHRQQLGLSFLNSSGIVRPCTNTEKATTANVTVTITS
jgi:hypothetical protein